MLRRIAPILLVTVLLFNVFGYYGIFLGLRLKASSDVSHLLETHAYNVDETVTLKLPLSIPYHVDQDAYKKATGEIEYNGEFYRLVKQKLVHDTLYVVCYKDKQSKNIKRTLADYARTLSDKNNEGKSEGKLFQNLIKDYIPAILSIENANEGWSNLLSSIFIVDSPSAAFVLSTAQPPEA